MLGIFFIEWWFRIRNHHDAVIIVTFFSIYTNGNGQIHIDESLNEILRLRTGDTNYRTLSLVKNFKTLGVENSLVNRQIYQILSYRSWGLKYIKLECHVNIVGKHLKVTWP